MKKRYTCIVCPNGCDMEADIKNNEIICVTGNECPRGADYVRQELTASKRTIATSIAVKNGELPLASVRLTAAIPREKIMAVMAEIKKIKVDAPISAGTVVLPNVCGLNSDVIITKTVKLK